MSMTVTVLFKSSDPGWNTRESPSSNPPDTGENFFAPEGRGFPQFFFNPQKLVVLGQAVAAAGRTGFYLPHIRGHGQIGDKGVFRLPGTVGDDSRIFGSFGHLDGLQGFGHGPDLVQFDQNGIGHSPFNSLAEDCGVGYEDVIADDLNPFPQSFG